MKIQQFYDSNLSHSSYAILSKGKIALVDPARDPRPYYDFAENHHAKITHVLETHPHADFVSSHLQIHKEKGADILTNDLAGPLYPYKPFNHDDEMILGDLTIRALHTPGHSPDSNSYLITDSRSNEQALFTGDFLFIGDVGRPDLREKVGNTHEARKDLAEKMYESLTKVLPALSDEVVIYPAHGAGSLCGKNLSKELFDILGNQRVNNWALQNGLSKQEFINTLLNEQPFIPKYFTHCVELNRTGAPEIVKNFDRKSLISYDELLKMEGALVIDTRENSSFQNGSYPQAFNIPARDTDKFETWLGSIISPDESFVLIINSEDEAFNLVQRISKIGYEKNVKGFYIADHNLDHKNVLPVVSDIRDHNEYLFIDIRQKNEHHEKKAFDHAQNIPLSDLRESISNLAVDRPIVVHCAGGYRSAIGSSIISATHPKLDVYDMSIGIKKHLT